MGAKGSVTASFHTPPKDLAKYFTTFCCAEIVTEESTPVADCMHPEWASLRVFSGSTPDCRLAGDQSLSGADVVMTGASSMPAHFSIGTTRLLGVGFLPLGWATFVGQPADQFANTLTDVRESDPFAHFAPLAQTLLTETSLGKTGELRGQSVADQLRVLTKFFRKQAPRFGNEDPRIQLIHSALIEPGVSSVCDLAKRCELNKRTLERLCLQHFGFSPKLLLRRQRFMRSLADFMLNPSRLWVGAIDSHYVDQPHFVRDCRDFLGMTPSEYAALDHPILSVFVRERMRTLGSAMQTLDDPN